MLGNKGYDACFEGVKQKFLQNDVLYNKLKETAPKILAEATPNWLWGTGVSFWDKNSLDINGWTTPGWLSRMLISIRLDY